MKFEKIFLGSAVFITLCGVLLLSETTYACELECTCKDCDPNENKCEFVPCCCKGGGEVFSDYYKYLKNEGIALVLDETTNRIVLKLDPSKFEIAPATTQEELGLIIARQKTESALMKRDVMAAPGMIRREAVEAPAAKEVIKKDKGIFRFFRPGE